MIIPLPDDQVVAVGVQFLQEQIRSNLTYIQENPTAVILGLLQSLQSNGQPIDANLALPQAQLNLLGESSLTHLRRGLVEDATHESNSDNDFIMNAGLSLMCVVFAGLASGLTQVSSWYF